MTGDQEMQAEEREEPIPVSDLAVTRDELLGRVAALRRGMADAGVDGLLLTTGDNLRYVSGYPSPASSGPRPATFILPLAVMPVPSCYTLPVTIHHCRRWT